MSKCILEYLPLYYIFKILRTQRFEIARSDFKNFGATAKRVPMFQVKIIDYTQSRCSQDEETENVRNSSPNNTIQPCLAQYNMYIIHI